MTPYPEISIVVLTYNRFVLIDQRLTELNRLPLAVNGAEVVVFDNGSSDGTMLVLASHRHHFAQVGHRLAAHRTEKNLGFAGGFNEAAKAAEGNILVLLSNDVRILGDFLPAIREELADHTDPPKLVAHEVIRGNAGWNQFGETSFPWPAGYFLALRKSTWTALGGFDTAFHPNDYEDVDIGYRAQQAGMQIVERRDMPIEHMVAQTVGYSPERYEQTVRMRALFAAKHGLENRPERP